LFDVQTVIRSETFWAGPELADPPLPLLPLLPLLPPLLDDELPPEPQPATASPRATTVATPSRSLESLLIAVFLRSHEPVGSWFH
jgi:hypothetical protein